MHAAFGFQPAIGVVPGNLVGRRFDPGLFARRFGLQFNLVALFLGPADIHPGQHRCPITAFGAARARVDLKEGIVGIRLAIQQRLDFLGGSFVAQGFQRGLGVGHDARIPLSLAHFDQFDIVAQIAVQRLVIADLVDQHLPVTHQQLRGLGVVPQGRIFDPGIEFLKPVFRRFPIHPLADQPDGFFD